MIYNLQSQLILSITCSNLDSWYYPTDSKKGKQGRRNGISGKIICVGRRTTAAVSFHSLKHQIKLVDVSVRPFLYHGLRGFKICIKCGLEKFCLGHRNLLLTAGSRLCCASLLLLCKNRKHFLFCE